MSYFRDVYTQMERAYDPYTANIGWLQLNGEEQQPHRALQHDLDLLLRAKDRIRRPEHCPQPHRGRDRPFRWRPPGVDNPEPHIQITNIRPQLAIEMELDESYRDVMDKIYKRWRQGRPHLAWELQFGYRQWLSLEQDIIRIVQSLDRTQPTVDHWEMLTLRQSEIHERTKTLHKALEDDLAFFTSIGNHPNIETPQDRHLRHQRMLDLAALLDQTCALARAPCPIDFLGRRYEGRLALEIYHMHGLGELRFDGTAGAYKQDSIGRPRPFPFPQEAPQPRNIILTPRARPDEGPPRINMLHLSQQEELLAGVKQTEHTPYRLSCTKCHDILEDPMTCQCDKAHDKIQLIWRRQLEQERQDILQHALQRHHPAVTSAVNWHQDAQPQQVNKRRVSSQDKKDAHIRQNCTPPFHLRCRYCNNDLEEDFSCICASQTLLRKRRDILILRGPKQQGHRQGPTPATASTSSLPSAGRVIPRMQRKEPTYSARYNPPRHKSPPVIRTNTRGNQGISLPHTHGIRQEPEDLVPEPKEPMWAQKKQGKSQPIAIDPYHHHPQPEQTWFSAIGEIPTEAGAANSQPQRQQRGPRALRRGAVHLRARPQRKERGRRSGDRAA